MKGLYSIEPLTQHQVERIESTTGCLVNCVNRLDFAEMADVHPLVEVLICRDRDDVAGIASACPNLKFIYIVSVGVEKLPFELLRNRGIVVANAGGVNAEIMSQYALAYILSQSARVCENLENQREGRWKKFQCVDDLRGSTLLIVGAGRVGSLIATKAHAFGMRVIGVKNHVRPIDGFEKVVGLDCLDKELADADYVVCSIPLTPATEGIFDAKRFAAMKATATFVNISRGGLVDEQALVDALHAHVIKAAVLDVFQNEPIPCDSPLWRCRGLYVTPHSSGRLENFMDASIEQFAKNLRAYIDGAQLPNEVDLADGY